LIPLPLRPVNPPHGYGWEEREESTLSTTTAFSTGLDRRDVFLGVRRCVICGIDVALQRCHIIMESQPEVWTNLLRRKWIPRRAKSHRLEPRNGLTLCGTHHLSFDGYDFFIRFFPDIRKFVFINYSDQSAFRQFHGKAIALDINDRHVPFPSLFIIHEMRVRGFHPFQPLIPAIPSVIRWQDWVLSSGVLDTDSNSFIRKDPSDNDDNEPIPQDQPMTPIVGGTSSGGRTLALNADVIAEILAATYASPSWRACEMEGTSWDGTAEENIQKYVSSIGVEGN